MLGQFVLDKFRLRLFMKC